ncbi:MAG: hypothetical protein M1819_004656 [Sarea resinae]|nr:MAG: hypothetical protein M1819_004656 [Sarea resinae]
MASSALDQQSSRSARYSKFFGQILHGNRILKNAADAKLFLEAICDQGDPANCVERIVASSPALESLRLGLRFDTSTSFINGTVAPFLKYLSNPAVKQICSGQFLQQILRIVVDPPTLWDALLQSFKDRVLTPDSVYPFAWLLSELLARPVIDVYEDAKSVTTERSLLDNPSHEVRAFGNKIQHLLLMRISDTPVEADNGAGGRHDNDFANHREIAVFPTADELTSAEEPFYRRAEVLGETKEEHRAIVHLDNQFRLLREEMLGEFRNDLKIATGKQKGRRSNPTLHRLSLHGIDCGIEKKRKPCTLTLRCEAGLPQLSRLSQSKRKAFLVDNRSFLRHQCLGCLMNGTEIIACATVDRDEALLIDSPPIVSLQFAEEAAFEKALLAIKLCGMLDFVMVDTAIFAYEPVLKRLQDMTDLPLAEELLSSNHTLKMRDMTPLLANTVRSIRMMGNDDFQDLLGTPMPVQLDESQAESLLAGLTQTLSLIQGPPGTGKSFIGALLAKTLFDFTHETILVICYTNHALDQFLEDLLDIGIPPDEMLRLGAKSSDRTKCLNISEQSVSSKRSKASWMTIDRMKIETNELEHHLLQSFTSFSRSRVTINEILEYLEFSDQDAHFYDALSTPVQGDGMTRVGRKGRAIGPNYVFERWSKGENAGVFASEKSREHATVWKMEASSRRACIDRWSLALLKEHISGIRGLVKHYNSSQRQLKEVFEEQNADIIKRRRIIGCTTTAAAKYTRALQGASPGVVLVEEAGEILESHVLTAMTPETKQLILIGDHKQLRPKVNNYALTVEKGDGYNLNQSLFERLVLSGFPHTTLSKQHRMCPEISSLIRHLTYPDLQDAPKTLGRPRLRGLQDRVIFFDHDHPEVQAEEISDRRDEGSKVSRQNLFEVEMVLKVVRYLAQQGYGTDKQVILTPYLGQLHLLRLHLSKDNDPILNDLDSFDLVRAGLLSSASATQSKRPIRISTIDNYQGEESDIVIATLTRSNAVSDIGFMAAPQRLNVLLSRARDALIMIGNANTFRTSRKGKESWVPFLDYLGKHDHLYSGIPVQCERHPTKKALLQCQQDFETVCPDGGCSAPCGKILGCGVHECPQRCHQLSDHSKVPCQKILDSACPRNHKITWFCHQQRPASCKECDDENRKLEKKRQRDHELEAKRRAKQDGYARQLAELQDEIAHERFLRKDQLESNEMENNLAQHRADLSRLKSAENQRPPTMPESIMNQQTGDGTESTRSDHSRTSQSEPELDTSLNHASKPLSVLDSGAKDEWEYQKKYQGADNDTLDTLMSMIGLEAVKDQFLSVKAKIDVAVRQNVDMKHERFSAALLGNPGTGKTTVARLYAQFLTSVGALPGNFIVETTGSRLANEGVSGCKKHIEEILNKGGGALFIDEAYQLASGQGYGGTQVLDFLLAEVEILTGKVVFILAGYNKQMEAFFAHNPGLPSRFPRELQFKDYEDTELLQILAYQIDKRYKGHMKIEDGVGGLYTRIVARRIGRGRGREGFGNARAVENVFARILERQAKRLRQIRRAGESSDDLLLTKEDLLGPEPSLALKNNASWSKLMQLTGLDTVKQSVQALLDSIQYNYRRELEEKPLVEYSLNKVFLGSPGTGKTSVAKLYGQILADIGLLSAGEVVVKNPSDFVGGVLGESEKNTKGILASTAGKVLVIDEAYGLYGSSQTDPYKTAVIDTIVAEVQSTPGEDRCVLLLGYKDQMEEMFQNVNPGLTQRFALDSAFVFEDFTDAELREILDLKLGQQGFQATDQGKKVALEVLQRARNRPHFGNAGEVDILLDGAKSRHQQRLSSGRLVRAGILEPQDFDQDFDRAKRAETNVQALFQGVVGCEDIVAQLEGYQRTAANMKARDMDPREQIPFNFLFRGPPGTGKTTTARRMGKVYYDMGFLATAEVVECSATDLVGQYVGQTGPKTQKLLEKALGKVLFIDEAYRLADGPFAKEAMDEIVDCLTKPKFAQKLVTILAGYDADINRLMSMNPGLTSRFPETVVFRSFSSKECVELLTRLLQQKKIDVGFFEQPFSSQGIRQRFDELSKLANWANARDVQTLGKAIFGKMIKSATKSQTTLVVSGDAVLEELDSMISERAHRDQDRESMGLQQLQLSDYPLAPPPTLFDRPQVRKTGQTTTTAKSEAPPTKPITANGEERDSDVSDQVWERLQQDKALAEEREREFENLRQQERMLKESIAVSDKEEAAKVALEEANAAAAAAEDDEMRRREEARLKHELERRAREAALDEINRKRKEEERKREMEAKAQKKLRDLGVCCAGFRWIKQDSGYRCAGGSHFVSNAQLG